MKPSPTLVTASGAMLLLLSILGCSRHQKFPEIHDWKSLRITMARSVCFGTCPAYSLEIHGDGSVRFRGLFCVAAKGVRTSHISQARVHALLQAFKGADFLSPTGQKRDFVMDAPIVVVGIQFDGRSTKIAGFNQIRGLQPEAARLPDLIDKLAETGQWVGRRRLVDQDRRCP